MDDLAAAIRELKELYKLDPEAAKRITAQIRRALRRPRGGA